METKENIIKKVGKLKIIEALLISYTLHAIRRELVLITDSVNPGLQPQTREFIMLKFSGVTNFRKIKGLYKPLYHADKNFNCSETEFNIVLQDINIENSDGLQFKLKVWFGESFGGIEIDFMALETQKKIVVGKKIQKDIWEYIDKNTGKQIDFYHPFSEDEFNK